MLGDTEIQETLNVLEQDVYEISLSSFQFFCEPKTALKSES